MKMAKLIYLLLGFIAGVSYLLACGSGGSKVEDAIGQTITSAISAMNVSYDNATSELQATNVQAAMDELKHLINAHGSPTTDSLVGSWTGTAYLHAGDVAGYALTLKPDGTYSCGGPGDGTWISSTSPTCISPISWALLNRTLRFAFTDAAGKTAYANMSMIYIDSSSMELMDANDYSHYYHVVMGLKKNP